MSTMVVVAAKARETRQHCQHILRHSKYQLVEAGSYSELVTLLCRTRPAVIVSEASLGDGTWKDILGVVAPLDERPTLIVIDRLADELLWAEVLSEGAYDLLAQPLDADELQRTIGAALRHRNRMDTPHSARCAAACA